MTKRRLSTALFAIGLLVLGATAAAYDRTPLEALIPTMHANAKQAVNAADASAMTQWASRYEHGDGIGQDVDLAIALNCVAGGMGDSEAAYNLGWIYANGRGGARDDSLAALWMTRAAKAGDQVAKRLLPRLAPVPDTVTESCILSNGSPLSLPLQSEPNPTRMRVIEWVNSLAPRAGLDPSLVLALIEVESQFNPRAHSPKNARGLMQLIPSTARRFQVTNIWDPLDNVRGGLRYLEWLRLHFAENVTFVLAGYNAGEKAVQRFSGIPPYRETENYVKKVMSICQRAKAGTWRFELDTQPSRRGTLASSVAASQLSNNALLTCATG